MIEQKKLNNIHKLELDEVLQIFHECVEALGITDLDEAKTVLSISKRRIYQIMNPTNSVNYGKHKVPCINIINKKNNHGRINNDLQKTN